MELSVCMGVHYSGLAKPNKYYSVDPTNSMIITLT